MSPFTMLQWDRERWGMSRAQTARRFGLDLLDCRKIESGEQERFDFEA
jgi:hypothetical protein